jgi:hypothetical protein
MKSGYRELLAGGAGVAALSATAAMAAPWWLMGLSAAGAYLGIRWMVDQDSPPAPQRRIILPEGMDEAQVRQFDETCRTQIQQMQVDRKRIQAGRTSFVQDVDRLLGVIEPLLDNFKDDPKDIRVASTLPRQLKRLAEMIHQYAELASHGVVSISTQRAMARTEQTVRKAIERFQQLHRRLLDDDAIELETNAKTLDNLLDLD